MDAITIYEDGRPAGTLHRRQEGLYTVFEAALPWRAALTRLWVFGGGARFCLGVMEPRPDGLYLRRRYSRAELRKLPAPIEYAATEEAPALRAGEKCPAASEEQAVSQSVPGPQEQAARQDGVSRDPAAAGPLVLSLGGARYLALPCRLRRPRPGLRLYTLAGRQYLLFRI